MKCLQYLYSKIVYLLLEVVCGSRRKYASSGSKLSFFVAGFLDFELRFSLRSSHNLCLEYGVYLALCLGLRVRGFDDINWVSAFRYRLWSIPGYVKCFRFRAEV